MLNEKGLNIKSGVCLDMKLIKLIVGTYTCTVLFPFSDFAGVFLKHFSIAKYKMQSLV